MIDSPSAICSIIAIPPLVALAIGYLCEPKFTRIANVLTALTGALLLFVLGKYALTTQLVFESAQMLGPVVVVIGAVKLGSRQNTLGAIREQQLMLLLSLSAICGLVQFPVPLAIYFCYYAPFLILTMLAIASDFSQARQPPYARYRGSVLHPLRSRAYVASRMFTPWVWARKTYRSSITSESGRNTN